MRRQRQRRRLDFEDDQAKKAARQQDAGHEQRPQGLRPDLGVLHQSMGNAAVGRFVEQQGLAAARQQALDEGVTRTTPEVEAEIEARSGHGEVLPEGLRAEMEELTGADLSDVRIHAGPDAESLSATLGAAAFTKGQDLFFGHRVYDPESEEGRAVLAHELTHAAEQAAGLAGVQRIAGAAIPLAQKPTIGPGARGPVVMEAQTMLNLVSCEHHPALDVDGDYQLKTAIAVACFQWRMGLEIDGTIGPATWTALQLMAAPAGEESEPPEPEEM
jgi:hypothetical protein